jgi:predicted nuclease with TOPRIM domain
MAFGRPPSVGIDKTAAQVHKKLAEVSSEAMIQLHKRSQSIHVTVEDSNDRIKKLELLNGVLVDSYGRLAAQYEEFKKRVEC